MSNNEWLSWVEAEVHQKPEQRTLNRRAPSSPMVRPSSSSTSSTSATTRTSSPLPQSAQQQSANTRNVSATNEMLDIVLPSPTQCFCRKQARRVYTSEYGPILVCSNFGVDPATTTNKVSSKYVCGFHVHEISWIKFCDTLRATNHVNIDSVELRSCPLYNFTFCAIFRTSNKFDMNPPVVLPKCFCHKPVIMRINRTNHSISFACKNGDVNGAKKCSWILPAHQVAFPRPKFNIHNCISLEEYTNRKQDTLTEKVLCPAQPASTPSSPSNHHDQPTPPAMPPEGHQADLLATLSRPSSNNHNTLHAISESSIQQPKTTSAMKPLIIPTCVMAKRPPSQPVLSRSSSTSSCSNITSPLSSSDTATLPISNIKTDAQQQLDLLKYEVSKIQNENSQLKSTINAMTTSFQDLTSKYDRLKGKTADLQTELHRSKNEHNEQSVLRINCQERLSKIELDVVHLMNDNENLKEEVLVMLEEKSKSGKDEELNKCRLCFTRNIEYCLIPCYHYGM
ncbi:hypothetical protein MAM1_0044c03077 [Mucor ambiguus]|uniref:Uncharacterized protein n=1 Tax=Mucor ambiguus TaxID=91626 RepID=A0A0C9MKF9_9FUNG|nr:hypothetical protein MAM1_0044c03077 [Mucor ambiguus]